MYHSITFGDKNTWDDWHLVPTSRPLFKPPPPKVKTLDIPGGDSLVDLSTSLTGYPVYSNREGSVEFMAENGFRPWSDLYSDIMDYLHGRTMRAILEDDPEYFYEGRFAVNEWKSEKDCSKIVIDYSVRPYKRFIRSSLYDWKWDPFNFTKDIAFTKCFKEVPVGTEFVRCNFIPELVGRAPTCPRFIVKTENNCGMDIRFVNHLTGIDVTRLAPDGGNQFPEMVFVNEPPDIYFKCVNGTGTISIDFMQGRL